MAGILHALFLVLGYAVVTGLPSLWSACPEYVPRALALFILLQVERDRAVAFQERAEAFLAAYVWHARGDLEQPLILKKGELQRLRNYRDHLNSLIKQAEEAV